MTRWSALAPYQRDHLVLTEVCAYIYAPRYHGDTTGYYVAADGTRTIMEESPDPTQNIQDAWLCVVALNHRGWRLSGLRQTGALSWTCSFLRTPDARVTGIGSGRRGHGDTAAEAICLAAVRTVGVEVQL